MGPLIRINGVWFDYRPDETPRDSWALRDVHLSVEAGEYVSVIGPNGSGKSTLAKLLNGLLLPVEGEVCVAGLPVRSDGVMAEIRRTVGLVFQNPENQIVATTVEDDIAFGLENLGVPREEMAARIRRAMEWTGLTGMEKRETHLLSGGQKQRLAIAGMLALEPQVLVLDEATSMLDPEGRREVLAVVDRLHRSGTTIIHITHDAREAFRAQRVVVMVEGQIRLDLPSAELYPRAMCLKEWGLDVPLEVELWDRLTKRGFPLPDRIHSQEELVHAIWKLLSGV